MLNNLKAEYTRKGIVPKSGVMHALNCTERTAKNKLDGKTPITIPEAIKIRDNDFKNENFSIDYLFAPDIGTDRARAQKRR